MKYIRTKDGIIDLSNVTIGENGWKNVKEYIAFKQEDQEEPIKVAGTIEELIDEYVAIKDNGKPFVIKKYEIHSNLQFGFTIYGSIWVNGNLIKVTKLNSRGELELL